MPFLNKLRNSNSLSAYPVKRPPLSPYGYPDPKSPEAWDHGFNRLVPILQSPPVGAGVLAITFFFLIIFFSNILLIQLSLSTLGIAVTIATFGLMALTVLILFLL
ncbi:hypothetical protein REC12_09960 [Desulfosporosinus sp. PR]|uniref:hypothetical protein n=1 Tax=Candidatus Desulfosporosinus nitrosoreducens TaxID=3401928 RepID=UPI0027FA51D0|nr:hypothetical protein [Desulfosporosinus sp. PR]MDQ7093914.1 hypothetical protein [Desulfosporosinus sp. PR]